MTRSPECDAEYSVQTGHDQALMALAGHGPEAATLKPIATLAVISLTNGAQTYEAELTLVEGQKDAVFLFQNGCPARGHDFWVCAVEEYADASQSGAGNVVSFPTHRRSTEQTLVLAPHMTATAAE
ncbi:hypothetical protein [Ruegeria arenilitoris]|uniref:hypothetical protein n=1 Tax=Ruegeria arenilitoris TaxID=1173585 RepID=UPI0014817398|nr:hypothetical protein [Ruegeria arenilitoris]